MKTRLLSLLFCLLAALPRLSAQTAAEPYAADWAALDSLLKHDLPVSAAQRAQQVYEKTRAAGQPVLQLKAQLYLLYALQNDNRTDSPQRALALAEREARTQPFPIANIWHSYAGELYQHYFQENSWRIRKRTAEATADSSADLREWSADRILRTAAAHYRASLRGADALVRTDLPAYRPILLPDSGAKDLRPTLYDLLAFRALAYFESGYQGLTRPADVFTIDDPRYFGTAAEYAALSIRTTDSNSSEANALRIYQQLLRLHLADGRQAALVDADLNRLQFVYDHTTLDNKDSLYEKALTALAARRKDDRGAAEALFRVQQLRYSQQGQQQNAPEETSNSDLAGIRAALEAIVRNYPGSEGAAHAKSLVQELTQVSISVKAEEVVLPGEPFKVLLQYRNAPTVHLRLLKAPAGLLESLRSYYADSSMRAAIGGLPTLRQWQQALPASGDYREHTVEIPVGALAGGSYLLVASERANWQEDTARTTVVPFQVSRLSLVLLQGSAGEATGVVADRKTGAPLGGVAVWSAGVVYNPRTKKNDSRTSSVLSGANGVFRPANGSYQRMATTRAGDTLFVSGNARSWRRPGAGRTEAEEADTTIWFFTDRAIYRPGQTVFFKGIVFRTLQGKSRVVPGYHGKVLLTDANDVEADSLAVTSNAFGSFHGSFRLPTGGTLTGEWTLSDDGLDGEQAIQVEEYKRPRFEVRFDTLAGSYRLNREVTVRGTAASFSGANVDGAQLRYRVTRQADYPWFFRGGGRRFGYAPAQEIGEGTALTDVQGRFSIRFTTKAPLPLDTDAVYHYEVTADVTDGTGETRSGSLSLNAGYRNLILSTPVDETARLDELDSFRVFTSNLNAVFQPADVQVTVEALQPPAPLLRHRLWPAPDQSVLDSVAFRRLFPNDEYRDESDPERWPRRQVYRGTKRSRRDGFFGLPRSAFAANGTYRLLLSSRDSGGKEVQLERYVKLDDARLPQDSKEPLRLVVKTDRPLAGQPVEARVQSGFDEATVFRIAENGSAETFSSQQLRGNEAANWMAGTVSANNQQLKLLVWTIRDNRLYQAEETVSLNSTPGDLEIQWESHRDKLLPGAAETWTMTLRGPGGERAAAEMAATLYDASLDQFEAQDWERELTSGGATPQVNLDPLQFSERPGIDFTNFRYYHSYDGLLKIYPELWSAGHYAGANEDRVVGQTVQVTSSRKMMLPPAPGYRKAVSLDYNWDGRGEEGKALSFASPGFADGVVDISPEALYYIPPGGGAPKKAGSGQPPITPRRNLQETAFFFPDLRTDSAGNVTLSFTMPEALTQWRLLAFAHTKNLLTGLLQGTVRTQKDLMVVPGLPRFLRQGDTIALSAKISNLSAAALSGTARIEVLDAATLQPLGTAFRLLQAEQPFTAAAAGSTAVSWNLTVPLARYEPVIVRITARAGAFTDGEDNPLPVLTNRTLVTDVLPLWLNGNGQKTVSFAPLASTAGRVAPQSLTVEYTANPAWLALQSLPYLAEYPYECAEQTFNRYYANALAAHLLSTAPRLKAIFARWQVDDTAALHSKLELNPELKSALLEETPWVLEAQDETEQRANLARLFSASRAAAGSAAALRQLRALQSGDGSFPWFGGGGADRYITQYIAAGLARLQQLGVRLDGDAKSVLASARRYLNGELVNDYREATKKRSGTALQPIDPLQVHCLYLNSLQPAETDTAAAAALRFYRARAARYWPSLNPYLKSIVALVLKKDPSQQSTVGTILQSLRETAIRSEEQGAHWIRPGAGYYWYEAPIEAQAQLIECFAAAGDSTMVDEAKRWLLKQKEGRHWASTKATADACYALLLTGTDWTRPTPQVSIRLGGYQIRSETEKAEAGTGYLERRIPRGQIDASMSTVALEVKGAAGRQPSWGAVYYQYFADQDAVRSSTDSSRPKAPLSVKKQFFAVRNTAVGEVLDALPPQTPLKVGDKVRVRIVLTADRALDYVHLKDSRPACLEPVDVLSGYHWQDGLGYYQSTRDASSNFFIDHLRQGTAVFEYSLFVTSKGDFGAGLATAQCLYAPEFAAHSGGMRLKVR